MPRLNDSHNLLLICHQAVIRCVLAFLLGTAGRDVPYIKVPLHCVMKVTFGGGENHVEFHRLPVECVDTYRPRADKVVEKKRDDAVEQIVRGENEAHSETLLN